MLVHNCERGHFGVMICIRFAVFPSLVSLFFRGGFAARSCCDLQNNWRSPWLLHSLWRHSRTSGAGVPGGEAQKLYKATSGECFFLGKSVAQKWFVSCLGRVILLTICPIVLSSLLASLSFLPTGRWVSSFLGGTMAAWLRSRQRWRGTVPQTCHM